MLEPLLRWQLLAFALLGCFAGTATGAVHHLPWNRPVHYANAVVIFWLFPSVFFYIAYAARSVWRALLLVFVATCSYVVCFLGVDRLLRDRFFDDMIAVGIGMLVAYSAGAILVHKAK